MAKIISTVSPNSRTFQDNRSGMVAQLAQLDEIETRSHLAWGRSRARFGKRHQRLPRDRVALLLDPGRPFITLSKIAGYGLDTKVTVQSVAGGGVIVGIGCVSGWRCMVNASDSGIAAGALRPMGLDKQLRAQEIALGN